MKFPQDFIERVRDATNIVDVIGQYVQLRRSGNNHQGLCPFHNEKSPSFSVSEDKQVYYCFGCKAAGNVLTFVQNYQGMTFPESIEYLARRASIALPVMEGRDSGDSERDARNMFFRINNLAVNFFHQQLKTLPSDHPVAKYMEQRGLTPELIDLYKLGYAPDAWSNLTDLFQNKKVPVPPAEKLGLIKRRTGGKSGHYDLFRHRVIFPIFSPTGDALGFGGRVLSKEQQPKYLNSPDSPVFHKGKVFYGLNHSAKFVRSEDEAIVVEGYMDWLALAKVSISNVVATLGTALTHDHARVIKRYTNRVLLLFDGDEAGKSAARRSLPILLSEGLMARGLFLPDQLDPDEFIKARGAPALRQLIQGAPDLFELISHEQWSVSKGSPTGKVQLLDEFAPILAAIQDPRLRTLYISNFANMAQVDVRLVQQSLSRVGPTPAPVVNNVPKAIPPLQEAKPTRIDLSKAPRIELEILNVIQLKEVYLKEAIQAGIEDQFMHSGARAVYQRICEMYGQNPSKFDTLSASLSDQVRPAEAITKYLSDTYANLKDEEAKKLLQDCIKRLKTNFLKAKSKELVSSLRGVNAADSTEQLEQIMNIHKNRRSLTRDS